MNGAKVVNALPSVRLEHPLAAWPEHPISLILLSISAMNIMSRQNYLKNGKKNIYLHVHADRSNIQR
jgi:hypothetical protein